MHSLGKTLLAFALIHSVLLAKYDCYFKYFLTSYYCIPVPYNEKDIFWGVLVLESLVGLHGTIQLLDFSVTCCGIDLGYCDTEWLALETNRNHSVVFGIASKYCISDSFVDYDGHSTSCK